MVYYPDFSYPGPHEFKNLTYWEYIYDTVMDRINNDVNIRIETDNYLKEVIFRLNFYLDCLRDDNSEKCMYHPTEPEDAKDMIDYINEYFRSQMSSVSHSRYADTNESCEEEPDSNAEGGGRKSNKKSNKKSKANKKSKRRKSKRRKSKRRKSNRK